MKKIHARQLTLKMFMVRPKKNSYKEFHKEKKFLRLKNSPLPPSPITFLMVRILKEPEQVSFKSFSWSLSFDANLLLPPKTNANTHNSSIKYSLTKIGHHYFFFHLCKESSFSELLTKSTRPGCQGEIVNCYVTPVIVANYPFKCHLW